MQIIENAIGGKRMKSSSGRNSPVFNPATGEQTATLPEAVILMFGQEGPGLTDEALAACTGHLSIAQFGSTRSINAAAAAAIAMHSWVRQHAVIG